MTQQPDWRKATRQAAIHHGLNPDVFERQIKQESGFNPHPPHSQAGAVGIAQFMPQTARGLGIDPNNPHQALNGAASLMASYVRKYGNYHDALVAYNAGPGYVGRALPSETRNYLKIILGNNSAAGGTSVATTVGKVSANGSQPTQQQAGPTFDKAGYQAAMHKAIVARLIASQGGTKDNALFQSGVLSTKTPDPQNFTITPPPQTQSTVGNSVMRTSTGPTMHTGQFSVRPGANRKGVNLSHPLTNLLSDVAGRTQENIKVNYGSNHSEYTDRGTVSDHWNGNGADLEVGGIDTSKGDNIAAHALQSAGIPWRQAYAMAKRGGLYTIKPTHGRYKGRQIQVIWKTTQGGNHHNHVHVGIH